jgi:phosphoglycerate dehydrogenase-like enzyme
MNEIADRQTIAHHFGEHVSQLLRANWPAFRIVAVDPERAWQLPPDTSILLSGLSHVWAGAPPHLPKGWPRDLRWIQVPAAGVDSYPKWLLQNHVVTTGQGINSVPIAEFVLASILALAKRFPAAWIKRSEDWRIIPMDLLAGKTLGLLGFGSIGGEIARRALAFDMRVLALRRSHAKALPEGIWRAASLNQLLAEADHLVLAAPHTAETHHVIDQAAIAVMKPGVHIINISRGALIEQDALLEGLDSNRVGAATLDVTDPEPLPAGHALYRHARVRLSPHTSWSGPGALDRLVQKFNQNLQRFLAREPLIDVLDQDNDFGCRAAA